MELGDTLVLETSVRKDVQVQVLLPVQNIRRHPFMGTSGLENHRDRSRGRVRFLVPPQKRKRVPCLLDAVRQGFLVPPQKRKRVPCLLDAVRQGFLVPPQIKYGVGSDVTGLFRNKMPVWMKWQTHWSQKPVSERTYRFKSCYRYKRRDNTWWLMERRSC